MKVLVSCLEVALCWVLLHHLPCVAQRSRTSSLSFASFFKENSNKNDFLCVPSAVGKKRHGFFKGQQPLRRVRIAPGFESAAIEACRFLQLQLEVQASSPGVEGIRPLGVGSTGRCPCPVVFFRRLWIALGGVWWSLISLQA